MAFTFFQKALSRMSGRERGGEREEGERTRARRGCTKRARNRGREKE